VKEIAYTIALVTLRLRIPHRPPVSHKAAARYLDAFATVDDTTTPRPTAPATGTTTAMARPSGACPPSLSRRPSTPLRYQSRRVRHPWLPQSQSPRHLLSPDYRRQEGASPSLRLDQPQTPLAASSRSDHQNRGHTPLPANLKRSQDHRGYPQCVTLHSCPAHACDNPTNRSRRLNVMKIFANDKDFAS
jgi:hypothetical protein